MIKSLTTNKEMARRRAQTNLYVMDRKQRQKEQVNCSLDQKDSERHYMLRGEAEPPLNFFGGTSLLCIYYSTLLNF